MSDLSIGKILATVEPWRRVLNDAADRIERDGWLGLNHATRGYCAYLAIWSLDRHVEWEASTRLYRSLGGNGLSDIFRWNDAPERTAAEVIAKLREVAAS